MSKPLTSSEGFPTWSSADSLKTVLISSNVKEGSCDKSNETTPATKGVA